MVKHPSFISVTENIQEKKVIVNYGWMVVIVFFFITTLAYGCIYSFGVFFKSISEDLGWSAAAISGVFSLYLISYCFFGFFSGWAVDRFGPKIVISLGGFFIGLGFLLTSSIYKLWQLYLYYGLLVGVGMSTAYAPLLATTSRLIHKRKGLALGIVSSGIGVGNIFVPPSACYLISQYGWRTSYVIMGSLAGGSIVMLALLFLKKDSTYRKHIQKDEELNRKVKTYIFESYSIRKMVFLKVFWLFAAAYLMVGFGLQMVIVHIVPYIVKVFKTSQIIAATIFGIMGASSIAGRLSMGAISDAIGRKKALIICVLLEGIAILILINVYSIYALYMFAVLFGFGFGGHNPQFPALAGELFGLENVGSVIGLCLIFYGIGGAFGPFLAGSILDRTGSYYNAFGMAGIAMLLAATFSLKLRRPQLC